ncbi:ATP-binding cassette domain-containing protein, partial [archaeon]
ILWGKAENSYLKQNSILEYAADGSRAAKRAARDAKKEESRLRFESAKAEAAAAADAASRREVVATSTVTYTLTEERKRQDVNITGFSMGYGGELLLSNADLHIVAGRRYGLVGRNGMGKSTLLRHMAHGEVAGAGAQTFPKNMRVLHVEQEVVGDSTNVLQTVLDADVERSRLLREEASLTAFLEGVNEEATAAGTAAGWTIDTANERIATIAARLEAIDAASAEARASAILAGLGFTNDMQTWPTKSLSGGWRMRVALAAALFCEPDVLCLDEPTNHIDAKSTLWLVEYLLTYPHTLIIVSHDRWFLNQVCTDVIHLTDRHLEYYRGDYDTYERLRAEKARHAARAAESQDMKRAHIQAFIDKFRYNAKRASLVQSRIKALERMEVLEEVADDPKWRFEFPDPGALPIPVLQIDDVTFG